MHFRFTLHRLYTFSPRINMRKLIIWSKFQATSRGSVRLASRSGFGTRALKCPGLICSIIFTNIPMYCYNYHSRCPRWQAYHLFTTEIIILRRIDTVRSKWRNVSLVNCEMYSTIIRTPSVKTGFTLVTICAASYERSWNIPFSRIKPMIGFLSAAAIIQTILFICYDECSYNSKASSWYLTASVIPVSPIAMTICDSTDFNIKISIMIGCRIVCYACLRINCLRVSIEQSCSTVCSAHTTLECGPIFRRYHYRDIYSNLRNVERGRGWELRSYVFVGTSLLAFVHSDMHRMNQRFSPR